MDRIRASGAEVGVVCAFGQLIREPLVELEMLNVHPSLIPRWRGAAPIERAIMAGDTETGVTIMRVEAGLDSGPVALAERTPIEPKLDYGSPRPGSPSSAGADRPGAGPARVRRARAHGPGRVAGELRPEDRPAERRLDPTRPAVELERTVRALNPHIRAYLELDGGERLGCVQPRPSPARCRPASSRPMEGRCGSAVARERCALCRSAGGQTSHGGRRLPAGPPATAEERRARAREVIADRARTVDVSAGRRAAYEVLRRVFEHDAWADRAFPAAAQRHGLDARERSQAQWLAYGAVKRRGTADHLIELLSGRPTDQLDRPVLAALRLGLFELLESSATPDHAAVDQAVELAKSGVAGESSAGRRRADGAAGLVNAVLRRAVHERAELLAGIDDSTPAGAAVLHSYPEWLARMWWKELGPAEARSVMGR